MEEKLGEAVLAVGELRQGKAPSMVAMVTGVALVELLRPRRSKLLPRRFVLAVTPSRVVAFKAIGVGSEDGDEYRVIVRGEEQASWPREQVSVGELAEGSASKGGSLRICGESFPVACPNIDGDPDTDQLLALLAR